MIDIKSPIVIQYKRPPVVKDPPRLPKVINPIEKEAKNLFLFTLNKILVDLTKEMVNQVKKNK